MNDHGFYIFLPSNASPAEFPNNKTNHFRVRFEKPISLRKYSQWEVALIELSYVHSLQTIRGDETMEFVATKDVMYEDQEFRRNQYEALLTPRHNVTFGEDVQTNFAYWYYPPNSEKNNTNRRKVCFYLYSPGTRAELSSRFATYLGFKKSSVRIAFPDDYKKPTEPPAQPPSKRAGQSDDDHRAEMNRYTILKEKYNYDMKIYNTYLKDEESAPPFVFCHHERQMDLPIVTSETCN